MVGNTNRTQIDPSPAWYKPVRVEPLHFSNAPRSTAADSGDTGGGLPRVPSPVPPLDLTATTVSISQVRLDWNPLTPAPYADSPGAYEWVLLRQEQGVDPDFLPIATLSSDAGSPTTYLDTVPEAGVYAYRLELAQTAGLHAAGFSDEADAVTFGTAQPAHKADPDDPNSPVLPATPPYTTQYPGTPGWYKVTLSDPSLGDAEADGFDVSPVIGPDEDAATAAAHQEKWLRVDDKWVQAKSATDAVMKAISGSIQFTANGDPNFAGVPGADQSFQSTFADGGFRLSPSHAAAGSDGTYTVGIDLDCDYLEGSLDWDDLHWSASVRKLNVDLTAYRTGGNFGTAVSDTVKQSADPSKYIVLVDGDYQVHTDYSTPDNGDPTADVDGTDTDLAKIVLHALPASLTEGTVSLTTSDTTSVRFFTANGSLMSASDTASSFSSPSGYLGSLLGQDVIVWVQGMRADPNFSLDYMYSDPSSGAVL